MSETTALGAAFAAGLAVGVWENAEELEKTWTRGSEYVSSMDAQDRNKVWAMCDVYICYNVQSSIFTILSTLKET